MEEAYMTTTLLKDVVQSCIDRIHNPIFSSFLIMLACYKWEIFVVLIFGEGKSNNNVAMTRLEFVQQSINGTKLMEVAVVALVAMIFPVILELLKTASYMVSSWFSERRGKHAIVAQNRLSDFREFNKDRLFAIKASVDRLFAMKKNLEKCQTILEVSENLGAKDLYDKIVASKTERELIREEIELHLEMFATLDAAGTPPESLIKKYLRKRI